MKDLILEIEPEKTLFLDYPVSLEPRYDMKNCHRGISDILNVNYLLYHQLLKEFLSHREKLWEIASNKNERIEENDPIWINGFIPGLDTICLYGMVAKYNPNIYLEVGSGNSTKVVNKAIKDNNLRTKIWSIDPEPRTEINSLCHSIIRQPLEEVGLEIFKNLEKGDILFVDNSHRVFMNSDVTTFFLDILPALEKGVIIQIHDVLLPYDYPKEWASRFYSEQYMLAMLLLFASKKIEVLMPNYFISQNPELASIINPLWENSKLDKVERHGGSFWFQIK
ncbi:class I SAM-dependent methyltransferase [Belliella pelovolcani]|uniref:class I SAM-dependent methyltransferase n=1 Tax=Belliella pelovolcani TaxID=529505 RepID=UPI00391881D0